ncbi:MAG: hypothetical protein QM477_11310 [Planctomycetota bacterium]
MLLALLLLSSQHPIAVLDSGTRVETQGSVRIGQRNLNTPFGRFDASLDPVASMADGEEDLRLLAPLKTMDYGLWLQRIAERGLLSTLMSQEIPKQHRALYQQLVEDWGKRLDPLPLKLDHDQRVETLWERMQKTKSDDEQLLLTGALMREVSDSSSAHKRRVGLSAMSKALKSKDPELRRAAARLAERQVEFSLMHRLVDSSLEDKDMGVRRAASDAIYSMQPQESLGRWTVALWRNGKDAERVLAADNLARYGSKEQDVVRALILAMGGESNAVAPRSNIFIGRQITAVTDFDVEVANSAVIADPRISVLVDGTMLEVRVVSVVVSQAIRRNLRQITGVNPGNTRADWMRWYENTYPTK